MALFWTNRFQNKHLHVIRGAPTLQQMVDEGYRIFDARMDAARLSQRSRRGRELRAQFGSTNISQNTLLVLSDAGLQALTSAILARGCASGSYTVKNGVIFNMTDNSYVVGLVAELNLHTQSCAGGYEVYHLAGAVTKARLAPSSPQGKAQTQVVPVPGGGGDIGFKFVPTSSELDSTRQGLRKVGAASSGGVPTWALGEMAGVDPSFLDD